MFPEESTVNVNPFTNVCSLEEYISRGKDEDFPPQNKKKRYSERFQDFYKIFLDYPTELGAMSAEINNWLSKLPKLLKKICKITDESERTSKIQELIDEKMILFLTDHGENHIKKVQEKALEIIRCFEFSPLSYYETFLLICAISLHDIGNIYGRANHEKRLDDVVKTACVNDLIVDSNEMRDISKIACVHGGIINGNKDTISFLPVTAPLHGKTLRLRLLAAILRFADELADDYTRVSKKVIKSGILSKISEIYHCYSSSLDIVTFGKNSLNKAWEISLNYNLEEEVAKKKFYKEGKEVYLLDEIYQRTLKMEKERRYCVRYLRPYCNIEKIKVVIEITTSKSLFPSIKPIVYELEEGGYPELSSDFAIAHKPSGKEMAEKLLKI